MPSSKSLAAVLTSSILPALQIHHSAAQSRAPCVTSSPMPASPAGRLLLPEEKSSASLKSLHTSDAASAKLQRSTARGVLRQRVSPRGKGSRPTALVSSHPPASLHGWAECAGITCSVKRFEDFQNSRSSRSSSAKSSRGSWPCACAATSVGGGQGGVWCIDSS